MRVVKGLVKGIVAGYLKFFESSGKTSHTVFHYFSISATRLSFWLTRKEKVVKMVEVLVAQRVGKGAEE